MKFVHCKVLAYCRVYNIGIEVRQGRGRYCETNIVTFTPRYQLDNQSSHKLAYAQRHLASMHVCTTYLHTVYCILCTAYCVLCVLCTAYSVLSVLHTVHLQYKAYYCPDLVDMATLLASWKIQVAYLNLLTP